MIPMPIFLPSGSSSGVEMVYPKWVEIIAYFGVLVAVGGLLWMITAFILSIITDDLLHLEQQGRLDVRETMTWKPIEGATNAPKGMRWWNNGESRFGGNYRHELRPESQPISKGTDETQAD